jgi:hypothetical protein
LGWLIAVQVGPVTVAAPVEPDGASFAAELAIPSALSADAGFAARWVIDGEDNRGLPFAIVDKKGARLYVFAPTGRFVGESPVVLGWAVGDMSIAGVASRAPASLAPAERTIPAGRFESQPGHNAKTSSGSTATPRSRSTDCGPARRASVVFQLRIPVAPEHFGDRQGDLGPGGDSLSHDRIDVLQVVMNRHRRSFQYPRAEHAPFGRFVDQHEHGVTDANRGVHQLAPPGPGMRASSTPLKAAL